MPERRRLGVQDALWLAMDRPNNLMVVDSVMWTAEPLDRARTQDVMVERLWDRYPVFRSRAVQADDGTWWWEEDPDASVDDLVTEVELEDPDDPRCLQELVAAHRTEPLDMDRPLWRVLWVQRYLGGSAVVVRSHHAIADGMRMVQLSMSLFDASPEGGAILAPAVEQAGARGEPTGTPVVDQVRAGLGGAGRTASGTARVVADAAGQTAGLAGQVPGALAGAAATAVEMWRTALTNPVGAVHGLATTAWAGAGGAAGAVGGAVRDATRRGGPLVDLFSAAPGDVDAVRKLLLGTRNDPTVWTGAAGEEKGVAWSAPLPLDQVKDVAHAHGSTVNDVLVTCVAGTLRRYLEDQDERCASVSFMVPVNLTPIDLTLPTDLGNSFALVQLELPIDEEDPVAVLRVARQRMDRIKRGHEAAIDFRIQETIAGLSRGIYEASVDLLANRSVGILTNVPGPPMPVYLAGVLVDGMVGWAPLSGDQPMSFTIYSYDGRVTVGIACDRHLVPDHETIVDGFAAAFQDLRARTAAAR